MKVMQPSFLGRLRAELVVLYFIFIAIVTGYTFYVPNWVRQKSDVTNRACCFMRPVIDINAYVVPCSHVQINLTEHFCNLL